MLALHFLRALFLDQQEHSCNDPQATPTPTPYRRIGVSAEFLLDEEHHEIRRAVVGGAVEPQLIEVMKEPGPRPLVHHLSFGPRLEDPVELGVF